MSQPNEPGFTTCPCQHCGRQIKFDATQFRKGETRTVECPHCHLETIIFVRECNESSKVSAENLAGKKRNVYEHKGATNTFDFVLRLIRGVTLFGAASVIVATVATILIFLYTLLPIQTISHVSYDEVKAMLPSKIQINTAETVPPSVAGFIVDHPDVKLDTSGMSPHARKVFLKNLSEIIQKAEADRVSNTDLVQAVTAYVNLWTVKNAQESPLSKVNMRILCITVVPKLFVAMAVLCLILVLLAIERNIRLIAEKPTSSRTTCGTD